MDSDCNFWTQSGQGESVKQGFLYAIQMQIPMHPIWPVKIGFTTDPDRRRQAYPNGPFVMDWIGCWEGTIGDEAAAHKQFAKHRLLGEWFIPTDDLVSFIEGSIAMDEVRGAFDALVEENRIGNEERYETLERIGAFTNQDPH